VDRLASALRQLAQREMPGTRRLDGEGSVRVLAEPLAFGSILDMVFDPIRRHARGETLVGERLLAAIGLVAAVARRDSDLRHLRRHAEAVHRTFVEATHDVRDREVLERAYAGALERLPHPDS